MSSIPQKTCRVCGTNKPLMDMVRNARRDDGYDTMCKVCNRLRGQDYYARNREQVIARTIQYHKARPDIHNKTVQTWIQRNHDYYLARSRRNSSTWREQNREKDRAASKRWRKNNPSAYRAIQHRRRARVRGAEGSYTAQEWEELKARYDYRCLRCGKQEPEIVLTVDHVVPVGPVGSNTIANIQPLCLSCNCSKQDRTIDYR